MFNTNPGDDLFQLGDAIEAFSELERNTSQAIIAQRSCERIDIKVKVTLQPGNCSQRNDFRIDGLTADISNGGFMALMSRPVMVGDFFWTTFDEHELTIGSVLAQCLRCRLVRNDAFEAGFKFLQKIDLADAIRNGQVPL